MCERIELQCQFVGNMNVRLMFLTLIASGRQFRALKTVFMSSCGLDNQTIEVVVLAARQMPNMVLLNVDHNDFGRRGAIALMRLSKRIHISCNRCAALRGVVLDDL